MHVIVAWVPPGLPKRPGPANCTAPSVESAVTIACHWRSLGWRVGVVSNGKVVQF